MLAGSGGSHDARRAEAISDYKALEVSARSRENQKPVGNIFFPARDPWAWIILGFPDLYWFSQFLKVCSNEVRLQAVIGVDIISDCFNLGNMQLTAVSGGSDLYNLVLGYGSYKFIFSNY